MTHKSNTKKHPSKSRIPVPVPRTGSPKKRWALLGLCLLLAGGGTWGFMEFVVWNKLPGELVGAWKVVQGPPEYREAVFEFHRSGKMTAGLNDNENLRVINAEVRVEGDKLYITTRRPSTGEEHVSVQTIRKLTETEFVVADERGTIMKMARSR
jgi:uncharacterized protein (TIGR03066 family)